MGEFSGKKFYGYSVEADPDLMTPSWNTKNFEFSCIRPEAIQRAIEKVQSEVGASIKQKKSHLLSKLRERGGEENKHAYQNRDIDVETCISKSQTTGMTDFQQLQANIRKMSDCEKGGSTTEHSSHSSSGGDAKLQAKAKQPYLEIEDEQKDEIEYAEVVIEEYNKPQPRWVEVIEPQIAAMQMFDLRQTPYPYQQNMYQGPMAYNPYMPPPQHMMAGYAYNPQQMMGNYEYQDIYTDYDPRAYQVEDSDLEDEMIRRKHYTKYCTQRPNVDETRISDENEGCAEFVNIAPQEPFTDMSFLKSTAPMRYSELSDEETQEDLPDQHPKVIIKKRTQPQETNKDKSKNEKQTQSVKETKQRKERTSKNKPASTLAQIIAEEKILANPPRSAIPKSIAKRLRKQSTSPSPHHVSRKQPVQSRNVPEPVAKPILVTPSGKSIEQLKAEKLAIFNKMSRTHERLIDALEQLRSKVMEVHIPESTSDRNRRNRNGFEFSVRFLRNFLYPLKGMIDTMRNTSREQFNSAASNDACNRVAHIYSLFLQAVLTYGKQLRHFMIDQVPQKLTTLLEMLFSTTNLCLDKRLFDRNDAIVECLISRCSNFLNFLEDLHAKRFVAARETYRKTSEEHPESKYNLKMFMNDLNMYEPKLVPKKTASNRQQPRINRKYVPSPAPANAPANIAPLPQPARRIRKRMKSVKTASKQRLDNGDNGVSDTSDVIVQKRAEADVPTQIQNWEHIQSSDPEQHETNDIIESLQNALINTPDLDKHKKVEVINRAIIEALKRATNDEARDVLKPLLKTINAVMDIPENSDEIENILKAFQTKISIALRERKFLHETGKGHHHHHNQRTCEASTSSSQQKLSHTFINQDDDLKEPDFVEEPSDDDSQQYEDCQNIVYDEDDDDGRFYISGEDCSSRRTTHSTKNKLEPLVEMVDENEFAELYFSDNDFDNGYTTQQTKLLDLMMNPVKQSPYDTPCCQRKSKGHKKVKSGSSNSDLIAKNKKQVSASSSKSARQIPQSTPSITARASSSKIKQTTVPPSPAMMRLKQRSQPVSSSRSKHHNLPKKHNRRDPMGSPPPAPTVSPSTSMARTPSTRVSDFHLSLGTITSSHKGCHTDMENCSKKSSRLTVTHSSSADNYENRASGISENNSTGKSSSHRQSPHTAESAKSVVAVKGRICESIQEENDSGEETARPSAQTKHRRKYALAQYNGGTESYGSGGDGPVVVKNDNSKCKEAPSKSSELGKKTYTLYPGNNPYIGDNSSEVTSMTTKPPEEQKSLKSTTKRKFQPKVNFEETGMLKERDQFLSLCIRNRLYTNPNYSIPWKILSRLSEQLTEEVVQAVESDFSSGVLTFVDDFLEQETKTSKY